MTPFVSHLVVFFVLILGDHISVATAIRNSGTAISSAFLLNVTQRHEQFNAAEGLLGGSVGQQRTGRQNVTPRRTYTAEELIHTRFPSSISDDIDMDPCKSGGFLKRIVYIKSHQDHF